MEGLVDTIKIPSGRLTNLAEYFENNRQSLHTINGDPKRKGVLLNGVMIEMGSMYWQNLALVPIYQDLLFGEIRIINNNNRK